MTGTTSNQLKPGDTFRLHTRDAAQRVVLDFEDGTSAALTLAPGSQISVVVGTTSFDVSIFDVDTPLGSLSVVPPAD